MKSLPPTTMLGLYCTHIAILELNFPKFSLLHCSCCHGPQMTCGMGLGNHVQQQPLVSLHSECQAGATEHRQHTQVVPALLADLVYRTEVPVAPQVLQVPPFCVPYSWARCIFSSLMNSLPSPEAARTSKAGGNEKPMQVPEHPHGFHFVLAASTFMSIFFAKLPPCWTQTTQQAPGKKKKLQTFPRRFSQQPTCTFA